MWKRKVVVHNRRAHFKKKTWRRVWHKMNRAGLHSQKTKSLRLREKKIRKRESSACLSMKDSKGLELECRSGVSAGHNGMKTGRGNS